MSQVTGVVSSIGETPWNGKTLYSVTVNGTQYGCGDKRPPCSVGNNVSFSAQQKGKYMNVVPNTLTVLADAPPVAPSAGNYSSGGQDTRQRIIQYQAARNSAIAAVAALIQADAIKLPAAVAKRGDAVLALIDSLTDRYDTDALEVGDFGARQRDDVPFEVEESGE